MKSTRAFIGKAVLLLTIASGFTPGYVSAVELFLGISGNQANLDTKEGDAINPQSSDKEFNLSFSAKYLDNYFGKSAAGYYIEFGVDTYTVERHDTNNYTSTSGEYVYLVPIVFYDFNKVDTSDWSLKIGIGAGIGYLTVDGTVVVNHPEVHTEHIQGSDFGLTPGLIIEYGYKDLIFRAKHFLPSGHINGLELELQLPTIAIGYKFDI